MPEEIASMEKGIKVNGLAAALQSFAFFFSLRSAVIVFSRMEMLIKALQSKKMTAAASSNAVEQTRTILQKFRQSPKHSAILAASQSADTVLLTRWLPGPMGLTHYHSARAHGADIFVPACQPHGVEDDVEFMSSPSV